MDLDHDHLQNLIVPHFRTLFLVSRPTLSHILWHHIHVSQLFQQFVATDFSD